MVSVTQSLRNVIALVCVCALGAQAAPDPDIFYLSGAVPAFQPYAQIPLRLGDGFTAAGGKITVKLVGNEAANTGRLYFLNPVTGEERFLFTNKQTGQPVIDLGTFPKGAPIVFKYITDLAQDNTYTGANQPGTYNFDADPALRALAVNGDPMPVSEAAVRNGDRRWAVAGRVDANSVVFGFEDQVGIDPDFNDIVFLVTGVGLDTEIKLNPPVISGTLQFRERATVTITPPAGAAGGEKVFYTTDGSVPTFDANGLPTGVTREYAGPFDVTATTTVKAVTWKANETGAKYTASEIAQVTFIRMDKLATPVASPPGGTAWSDGLAVTLTQAQGGEIHYVLCDPKQPCPDPSRSSPTYVRPVDLTRPTLVKAIAYKDGWVESDVLTAAYLLSLQVVSAVYIDQNGDGRIDAARIQLSARTASAPEALVLDDPFTAGASVTVPKARIAVDPADASVLLAGFAETPFAFGTAFPDKEYGHITAASDLYPAQSFVIRDSVGPVIVKAEATQPADGQPAKLKVTFSEDVAVDLASKEFPYHVKRAVGADPNGQIQVDQVVNLGNRTYEYVFVAGATRYPVDGDSLKLMPTPTVRDAKGVESRMGHYVPVKGAPSSLQVEIQTRGGDWVRGDPVVSPRPVKLPVSLILPPRKGSHDHGTATPECLDCRTGEWRVGDPSRPKALPGGPYITITTKGPFDFDIRFFDNLGGFVNRAKGTVTEAMLTGVPKDAHGTMTVALMWYPVSETGSQAGTGAYIAMGTVTTLAGTARGPQGETVNRSGMKKAIQARFGYVRR